MKKINIKINYVKKILDVIEDVKKSALSVRKYFSTYDVPFTRKQYYKYLKRYNRHVAK